MTLYQRTERLVGNTRQIEYVPVELKRQGFTAHGEVTYTIVTAVGEGQHPISPPTKSVGEEI